MENTAKEGYLRAHIEQHYSVHVSELSRLDKGVFKVTHTDGRCWVVRVFPTDRPHEHVVGDADILQYLEKQSFPAERCAVANPVSSLHGRGILVTEYIEGTPAALNERTLRTLGALVGRLNGLPAEEGAGARAAGSLHHYAHAGGGPQHDLLAAAAWLAAIEERVPQANRPRYESLRQQLADADACQNLPEALIHPDPVLKNLLTTKHNGLVFIDWTGAGRGPRLAALANLIWSCALTKNGWSPRRVDAVVAGYRSQVHLAESEVARLARVMRLRPLVFACWRYYHALLADQPPDGTEWWWPSDELSEAVAGRACMVLQADD